MTPSDDLLEMFDHLKAGAEQDRDIFSMLPELFNPLSASQSAPNSKSSLVPSDLDLNLDKEHLEDCDFLGNKQKIGDSSFSMSDSMSDEHSKDDDTTMTDASIPHTPVKPLLQKRASTVTVPPRQSPRTFESVMKGLPTKPGAPYMPASSAAAKTSSKPMSGYAVPAQLSNPASNPVPTNNIVNFNNSNSLNIPTIYSLLSGFQSNQILANNSTALWLQYYAYLKCLILEYDAMITPWVKTVLTVHVDMVLNSLTKILLLSNTPLTNPFLNQYPIFAQNFSQKPILYQNKGHATQAGNPALNFSLPSSYNSALIPNRNSQAFSNKPATNSHSNSTDHRNLIFTVLNKRKTPYLPTTSLTQTTTLMHQMEEGDKPAKEPPLKKNKTL